MLKIGQNWGNIANYPPSAQQRSAPLILTTTLKFRTSKRLDQCTSSLFL